MIPKQYRGLSRAVTNKLFGEGKRIRIRNGFLAVAESPHTTARIAVSVSSKNIKTATLRSKSRRRIQAAFTPLLDRIKPRDILFVWTGTDAPDTQQLREELFQNLKQHQLIKPTHG